MVKILRRNQNKTYEERNCRCCCEGKASTQSSDLIAILEADLRYINNNNIVYNDTDDVVLTEDRFTYI